MTTAAIPVSPLANALPKALLLIALGGALTGFSPILARISDVGPLSTAAWRMAFAALALAPLLAVKSTAKTSLLSKWPLLLAGLFFAIDLGFYHWALQLTSVAHATLIVNMAPVVALAAGVLAFSERLGKLKLGGLIVSIAGALLMTTGRADVSGTLEGNTLAVAGMLGYAFYLIAVKRARGMHDTAVIMVWSSASAALLLFIGAALAGEIIMPQSAAAWGVVIAMGLITHVAGQGLVALGMRDAPVGLAAIVLFTQPVMAALAAWVVFGETMGVAELWGVALVLGGIALATRSRQ
ncbi:MAG: DMT family transporter [Hyphomicrobiales bacterium]|nr:DMT family transporter [Hyphomicrobiales bacterium]